MTPLQNLWHGNIRPNEDKVITDEEKELVELIARHHETLSSSLKNDDLVVFEKYVDCFTEYASLIDDFVFGGDTTKPSGVLCSSLLTVIVFPLKSTSFHSSARISPRRIPVVNTM